MVDRLGDLGIDTRGGDRDSDTEALRPARDLEVGETFMKAFFDDVGRIKTRMGVMRRNIKLMEQAHQSALTAISMEKGKEYSDELDRYTDETNRIAQEVRGMLKKMDDDNHKSAAQKGTAEERVRTNTYNAQSRAFLELMKEYQGVQQKYKEKYRDRVARQYKIVNPAATTEEIDEVLTSGQPVFSTPVLSQGQTAAMNALADIQEKHQDILKLERSLEELHQLFVDMAIMVEAQGELLDQIEHSIENTVAYTEQGVSELVKAKEHQKSARKKMCIIACCLIILAAIIFGTLGGFKLLGNSS